MSDKRLSGEEIAAFKLACKNNGIRITQNPQTKIKSASIKVGKSTVSVSKDLSVARRTRIKVK